MKAAQHIRDCQIIAEKWGAQQVITIGIYKGDVFEVTSYGETKQLCAEAKKLNERIFKMLGTGESEAERLRKALGEIVIAAEQYDSVPSLASVMLKIAKDALEKNH